MIEIPIDELKEEHFYEDDSQLISKKVTVTLYSADDTVLEETTVSEVNINDFPLVSSLYNMAQTKSEASVSVGRDVTPNFKFTLNNDGAVSSYQCYF